MGSRVRHEADHIFEVFVEVAKPAESAPFILQKYPEDYNEAEVLGTLPKFAFPCETYDGQAVDHFTFVLTDMDSKFKFGFCRHATGAQTCLCIVSCLPWYEIFYRLLNYLAEAINRDSNVVALLQKLYTEKVPEAGQHIDIVTADLQQALSRPVRHSTGSHVTMIMQDDDTEKFAFITPDPKQLPTIPESRNLTEYFNAVDANNMMILFASMLYERRVLIVSKKLSRLTACIHGAALLLYPMFWQYLYIPVLPKHLIDYCSAPMPYLIGVHTTIYQKLNKQELGDAVVLDADNNTVITEHNDLESIPPEVVATLKKKLRSHSTDKSTLMGDGVSRTFLKAMVVLIGGYRDALRFRPGEQITFDTDAFIQSRPHSMKVFLESMLHLQIFEQFVNERLDLLNAGVGFTDEFELECNMLGDKWGTQSRYKDWSGHMKKTGKKMRREGKDKWVEFTSKVKDKSKKAYKNIQSKIDDLKKDDDINPGHYNSIQDAYEAEAWPDITEREEGEGHVGDEVPAGISRTRPQTIPTDILRRQRPPRPPPPAQSTAATSLPETPVPLTVYKSYHRRTEPVQPLYEFLMYPAYCRRNSRQYKVINLDDMGESHAPRVTKRVSSRVAADDSDLRESDLQRVSLDLMGDPDILNVFQKSYSLEDLALVDEQEEDDDEDAEDNDVDLLGISERSIKYDGNSNRREASIRESLSSHELTCLTDDLFSSPPPPIPAPRMSIIRKDTPLINLGNSKEELTKSDSIEFDPLKLSAGVGGLLTNSNSSSESSVQFTSSSHSSQESLSVTPKQRGVNRKPAFYNQSRPPSVRNRKSPTPAMDASGIKEARTAFMETTVPAINRDQQQHSVGLDQFDPLATGQLVMDKAEEKPHQENLLKEWNLDFGNKAQSKSPVAFPPQRPPQRPVYRPVTNSPFLQQQQLMNRMPSQTTPPKKDSPVQRPVSMLMTPTPKTWETFD